MRGRAVKTPERIAEAQRLRDAGLTFREIGERLGIATSTADAWLKDPDGTRLKQRKQTYAGTCLDCGTKTSGSEGRKAQPRCPRCAARLGTDPDPGIPGLLPIREATGAIIDFARVDLADWDRLRQHRFYSRGAGYVGCNIADREVYLHHLIIGHLSRDGPLETDHINRDKLDNRRQNLRAVTRKENNANRGGIYERARLRRLANAA